MHRQPADDAEQPEALRRQFERTLRPLRQPRQQRRLARMRQFKQGGEAAGVTPLADQSQGVVAGVDPHLVGGESCEPVSIPSVQARGALWKSRMTRQSSRQGTRARPATTRRKGGRPRRVAARGASTRRQRVPRAIGRTLARMGHPPDGRGRRVRHASQERQR